MRPPSAGNALQGPALTLCDVIQRGYLSQVPLLVKLGISLGCRDSNRRTPLMLMAFVEPEDWGVGVARLLIESGVRMSPRDRMGRTALHYACIYDRLQLAAVLLHAPDFDLAQTDRYGNTALHYAAMSGNTALVRQLAGLYLRYKLPLDTRNLQRRTAREEADHHGHSQCSEVLDQLTPAPVPQLAPAPPTPDTTNTDVPASGNINIQANHIQVVVSPDSSSENLSSMDSGEDGSRGNLLKPGDSSGGKPRRIRSANSVARGRLNNRMMPRPSLPALSGGVGGGEPVRKLFARENRNKNKSVEDIPESCQEEETQNVEIVSLEKSPPPSRPSSQKRGSVFRERTNLLHHLNGSVQSLSNSSSSLHKLGPGTKLRRSYTFSVGSCPNLLYTAPPPLKDPESVIHVASEHDFRNTREYVLKLTHLTSAALDCGAAVNTCWGFAAGAVLPHGTSSINGYHHNHNNHHHTDDYGSRAQIKRNARESWRDNIRSMYQTYDYQWSASWRKAAKLPPPPPPSMLLPDADGQEEGKDRKMKRSGSQMSELSNISLTRLRKINAARRRMSSVGLGKASSLPSEAPGRDTETGSPDTASVQGTSITPLTNSRKQRPASEDTPPGHSRAARSSPSPDSGAKKPFIALDQASNSDVTSAGNGLAAAVTSAIHGNTPMSNGKFRRPSQQLPNASTQASRSTYPTVPAVMESLVGEGDSAARSVNTEPAKIDTNRLYVHSDVEDDDDDDNNE